MSNRNPSLGVLTIAATSAAFIAASLGTNARNEQISSAEAHKTTITDRCKQAWEKGFLNAENPRTIITIDNTPYSCTYKQDQAQIAIVRELSESEKLINIHGRKGDFFEKRPLTVATIDLDPA